MKRTQNILRVSTNVYLVLMLCVFPLYYVDHYLEIASYKWTFFLRITDIYCMVATVIFLYRLVAGGKERDKSKAFLDIPMLIYAGVTVESFVLSVDKEIAWNGVSGWYMGLAAQLLFVLVYFIVSRSTFSEKVFLRSLLTGSGICLFAGILQRVGVNFFYLYYGMPDYVKRDFISFIGNRTWYSGYLCLAFPVGMYLFWEKDGIKEKIPAGIYTALAFSGMVLIYSDSVFPALLAVFFVLGILSIGDDDRLLSFGMLVTLWFLCCLVMGRALELCDPNRPRLDPRGMAKLFLGAGPSLAGTALGILFTAAIYLIKKRKKKTKKSTGSVQRVRTIRVTLITVAVAVGLLAVLLVALNTTGTLEKLFHISSADQYLYFDDDWGDDRGFIWRICCRMFGEMPLFRKLFGVGPDCLIVYAYTHPVYSQELIGRFGDTYLTNAHNEWLNAFLSLGLVGGAAYLYLFIRAAAGLLNEKARKKNRLLPAIGLCVIAYMAHGFFCYQQLCAAVPLFIFLGVAASIYKS